MKRPLLVLLVLLVARGVARGQETPDGGVAPAPQPPPPPEPVFDEGLPERTVEITERRLPGSAHEIGKQELERFERDDIEKVIATVPGVYARSEDGYGLRPNIGMRGASSERSAKITLMEDGVLIAPAPYAAPAAYYFPLVTRMTRVEVIKGPSAILYGPTTVGGALNLFSRAIPRERTATVDFAAGSHYYGKAHGSVGQSFDHFGFLVEAAKLYTTGFKELDGGGNTGFDKNDVLLKLRVNTALGERYQELALKVGYADEVSNESYAGLTDEDFQKRPYRRYAGTRLDRMDWRHLHLQLSHKLIASGLLVETTVYRNTFDRAWKKLEGFQGGRPLGEVLQNPRDGANAVFYAIVTGMADSTSPAEALLLGTNDRKFVSQGIQSAATLERTLFGRRNVTEIGLRLHHDEADRVHLSESYDMRGGALVPTGTPPTTTVSALGSAIALSGYLRHRIVLGPLEVSAGMRGELIRNRWVNRADPAENRDETYGVLAPGAGILYALTKTISLLGGIHRGFAPLAPGPSTGVKPEQSINYEAGGRYFGERATAEVIGFVSDYSNLKGTCTLSSGCTSAMFEREFNGGAVHVYGVETMAAAELPARALRIPLQLTYTFQRSSFQHAFQSENPEWGEVQPGHELPYFPNHQLATSAGLRGSRFELTTAFRFVGAMRNTAGQGEPPASERTEVMAVLDLAGHIKLGRWGQVYTTVDNVLDRAFIASRRPYGVRPGVPRLVMIGYKNEF